MDQTAKRTVARVLILATTALALLAGFDGLQAEGQIPIPRVGGPRLKISLNAYSFNKLLSDHLKDSGKGMNLFELLDFCAEQNFDAIAGVKQHRLAAAPICDKIKVTSVLDNSSSSMRNIGSFHDNRFYGH